MGRPNEDEVNSENEDKDSGKLILVNMDLFRPAIITLLIRPRIFFGDIHRSWINNDNSSLKSDSHV